MDREDKIKNLQNQLIEACEEKKESLKELLRPEETISAKDMRGFILSFGPIRDRELMKWDIKDDISTELNEIWHIKVTRVKNYDLLISFIRFDLYTISFAISREASFVLLQRLILARDGMKDSIINIKCDELEQQFILTNNDGNCKIVITHGKDKKEEEIASGNTTIFEPLISYIAYVLL